MLQPTRLRQPRPTVFAGMILGAIAVLSAQSLAAHDYEIGGLKVIHPTTHPTTQRGDTAAIHALLRNDGDEPLRLMRARAHVAASIEAMPAPSDAALLTIPAGETFLLSKDSQPRLLLKGLKAPLHDGERVTAWLTVEDHPETAVELWVTHDHEGHD